MIRLNLPACELTLKKKGEQYFVKDIIRGKFCALTPEEWVRQHVIHYLLGTVGVPRSMMAVEVGLMVNNVSKRADIVVYNRDFSPLVIVECKAPSICISNHKVEEQILVYNLTLKSPYLLISNGLDSYFFRKNPEKGYERCTGNWNYEQLMKALEE